MTIENNFVALSMTKYVTVKNFCNIWKAPSLAHEIWNASVFTFPLLLLDHEIERENQYIYFGQYKNAILLSLTEFNVIALQEL